MNKKEILKKHKPVDASKMLTKLIQTDLTEDERQQCIDVIRQTYDEGGNELLLVAFQDKLLTEEEFIEMKNKYLLEPSDWMPVLQAYYNKPKSKEDKVVVITMEDSPIHRAKGFILKRFKIEVKTANEMVKMIDEEMEKNPEMKGDFEQFKKEMGL